MKEYDYKFSVVMAVYNAEDYLAEAVESVTAQDISFKDNVQLILVDDGSQDASGEICDQYAVKFPFNIVVIHKEFNQRILITTHSPYFLEAIEVFSERHNVNDHCKYYMAETEGDAASIIDATGNIEKIYSKLARPFQELENLRYSDD